MTSPQPRYPWLTSPLQHLRRLPAWALLSLVMNGLLFFTLLVMLQRGSRSPDPMLASATAVAADAQSQPEAMFTPRLGNRQVLNYDQWVGLLKTEAEAAARADLPHQAILLGDSLTLWFPPELLPGRRSWLNQAISGEQSLGLLNRLTLLDQNTPEVVFIMVGINDLIWGSPVPELVNNLGATVKYLHSVHPQARIVVQSILPHGGAAATWEGRDRLANLSPQEIVAVNGQIRQVATAAGATYLDLYPLFVNDQGYLRSDLTTDGLHLNHNGYLVWRTALAMVSEADYPGP